MWGLWLAMLLLAQATGQTVSRPPFYFCVPSQNLRTLPELSPGARLPTGESLSVLHCREFDADEAVLRILQFPGDRPSRSQVLAKLEQAGLVKAGDVVLTFRPSWADTLAYPHVQMGTSHAGVLYRENGKLYSLDMPLDAEYNREGFRSRLDSQHYLEVEAYHILRPRGFNAEASDRLAAWVAMLRKNVAAIRQGGLLSFNSDYLHPQAAVLKVTPDESVRIFGRILKGEAPGPKNFNMFCSEFVWHLLSLSLTASPDQPWPANGRAQFPFPPQNFLGANGTPGLTEGPLLVLQGLSPNVALDRRQALATEMFENRNGASLSNGHRLACAATQPILSQVRPYYLLKLAGGPEAVETADKINALGTPNYSPTSFFVNGLLPLENPGRKMDYLFTVYFSGKP